MTIMTVSEGRMTEPRITTLNDRIVTWIAGTLARKPTKRKSGIADALRIDRGVITKIMKRERAVSIDELAIIAGYLEEPMPNFFGGNVNSKLSVTYVPLIGDILEKAWHNMSLTQLQATPATVTVPIVSDPAPPNAFALRDGRGFVVYEPYWKVRRRLFGGDMVVVEHKRGSRYRPVLRRVHAVDDGFELRHDDSAAGERTGVIRVARDFHDDDKIKIIGRVIWRILPP